MRFVYGIALVLAFGLLAGCATEVTKTTTTPDVTQQEIPPAGTTAASGNTVELTLKAGNYYLNPNEVRVKQGDTVIIHFSVETGNHGLGIEGYGVDTGVLGAGETKTVRFVADKKGTFAFFCNVPCGSGHRSMRGQLVVE